MHRTFAALAAAITLHALPALAQSSDMRTDEVTVRAEIVAEGLDHPWGLDFLPGGGAIVTEREGQIRLLTERGVSQPVTGVPRVWASGQGGLLDIAVAPDFAQTAEIYFSFSEPGSGGAGTAVARANLLRDPQPRLENVEIIFSMAKKTRTRQHFGSRLVFGADGMLFVTTGDRGQAPRAQDMMDHAGAVLRIGRDGSIPADNPHAVDEEARPEIWSKGHRNVQGAALHPATGELWTVEHGARGGDELNRPRAGLNYGWPRISYGRNYSGTKIGVGTEAEGFEQPVFYWDPSIAPSGLDIYSGDMFPEWEGDFLVGALRGQLLSRLTPDGQGGIASEERMFQGEFGRIRDVDVAPDGSIWLITDEGDGRVIRLSRAD